MSRNYNDWLYIAKDHKNKLDQAIAERNAKDVIYYRGKYLFALKQAHKLNPSGIVPQSVTNYGYDVALKDEIQVQLTNHKNQIDASLRGNKNNSSIRDNTLTKEIGLKIRRLSTRISQVNFATNANERKNSIKGAVKDSASMMGTVAKAPIMVAAKVTSAVGPLAITICALPLKVFASLLTITIDAFNGKASEPSDYMNTPIDKLSDTLKDGVKKLSKVTYESVGRI